MTTPRFLPFPGYPTTEGTATALVSVASLLAGLLLLAAVALIGNGIVEFVNSQIYAAAPTCTGAPNAQCRDVRQGVIEDAAVALPGLRGEHYEVKVRFAETGSSALIRSPGTFDRRMVQGDQVSVTYWHGEATRVDDHGVEMTTAADPSQKYRNGLLGGFVFGALGIGTYVHYIRRPLRDLQAGRFRTQVVSGETAPGVPAPQAPDPASSARHADLARHAVPPLGLARWVPGYAVPVVSAYNAVRNLLWTVLAILIAYSFAAGAHFKFPHPDTAGGTLVVGLFLAPVVVAVVAVALLGPRAMALIVLDLRRPPVVISGVLDEIRPSQGGPRPIYMGINLPVFPATGFAVLVRVDGGGRPVWVFAGWRWASTVEVILATPPESRRIEASYFPHTHALADLRLATQ
jgi:hypothetical protein